MGFGVNRSDRRSMSLSPASDLSKVGLGAFITHLNAQFKLNLQKKDMELAEKALKEQWFNAASDLSQADSAVLMMIEPPISRPLLVAIHSFFHPNSAVASAVSAAAASGGGAAPTPTPVPHSLAIPPISKQSSEGKNAGMGSGKLPSPMANDNKSGAAEGDDDGGVVLDEEKKASLEGLKKAVDQVCADPKMADPYTINQLTSLLKKGMSDSGKMTQSVLREYLKRVQDAGAQSAAYHASLSAAANSKQPPPLPPGGKPIPPPLPSLNGKASAVPADGGLSSAISKLAIADPSGQPLPSARGGDMKNGDASPLAGFNHTCAICSSAKDKPINMDCKHVCCTICLHDHISNLVGQKKAVGMKCPFAGCNKEISVSSIKAALSAEEFNSYLESTLYAFMEEDKLTFTCPKAECKAFISIQPIDKSRLVVPKVMVEKDDEGKVLSKDAWLHFSEFRLRCRACQTIFCAQCKVIPYHKGYTCKGWTEYQSARHCRFCHCKLDAKNTAPNPPSAALRDVCTLPDCMSRRDLACDKTLKCGCNCGGLRGESPCMPCLKHDLNNIGDDFCPICFVEALSDAPCFQSTGPCKHVFHFHCAKQRLDTRWPGARVSFEFRTCPVCKQNMNGPALKQILAPILELESFVQSKSLERLKYEGKDKDPQVMMPAGRYYNKQMEFAMHLFLFFMCYQCKKPYFAGGYQCQEANAPFDPKELICPSCQPSSVEDCPTHGKDWLAFKCRYCCNFANWYCWAKVHFCDLCHKDKVWQTLSEFRTGKNKRKIWDYPQCAGLQPLIAAIKADQKLNDDQKEAKCEKLLSNPATCPIKMRHPPNGFEFGIGCSMCEDKQAPGKKDDKPKASLAPSFALNLERLKNELKSAPRLFQYTYDFDNNGLCYWLGTSGGAASWSNPADAGFIKITTSELMGDSAPASASVGREVVRCVSKPVRNSWFCFDFLDIYIQPTHYSLRHYSTWDTECLRFWVLEGSNDGMAWDPLCSHANDPGLNKKGGTKTWALPPTPKRYRMFRLIQTDKNSNGNFYLAISGFEVYGALYADPTNGAAIMSAAMQPVGGMGMGMGMGMGAAAAGMAGSPAGANWVESVKDMTVTECKYASDFDTNGMMYWLGTGGGKNKWSNPAELGLVACACSELAWNPPSQPASAIVGREPVRCVSAAKPNMWFSIDLKEKKALVTNYTLRHYTSWDAEALRNWRLEASNDGLNWTVLRTHTEDAGLNGKGSTYSWMIERPETKGVFSLFRIYQTGVNSNSHHYLPCSGWEMYGKLYSPPAGAAGAAGGAVAGAIGAGAGAGAVTTCTYASDFDTNGVFYWLGTRGKTAAWRNPVELGAVQCYCAELAVDPPSYPPSAIVGRETVRCVSAAKPHMWFMIDMKDKRVNPTHYSLKHYLSWDTEALRYWRLEASNDGINWEVLRNHVNDPALNKKGGTHTWALLTNPKGTGWRCFRLYQTGPNSNNHHYLSLSGWEFYGTLITVPGGGAPLTAISPPQQSQLPQQPAMMMPPQPQAQPYAQPPVAYGQQQQAMVQQPMAGAPYGFQPIAYQNPNGGANGAPQFPGANFVQPNPAQMMAVQPNNPYVNYPAANANPFGAPPPPLQAQPSYGAAAGAISLSAAKPLSAGIFQEGREFKYQFDFDMNGIIYFLGTAYGTREWKNPGQTGIVQVSSSPLAIQPPSLPAWGALSRTPCRCVTQAVPDAWFLFDLQNVYVLPTHYTLRHYETYDNEALYDWKFQASNDAKKWKTLVTHKKDPAFNKKSATKTWPIPKPKKAYRLFRVLQTDKNNNGHFFCPVAGFEIYGKLYTVPPPPASV